jgi:2-hydroxychromene-2-carboxylate isomerase
MTATRKRLEFWYDFASPYCYLAAMRIEAAAAGLEIEWRPFLLGPIFKRRPHDPTPFQNPSPAERAYRWRDVERHCQRYGLPWQRPSTYPRNGLTAARITLLALDEGWGTEFSRTVFHANFAEDLDISDEAVLFALAERCGRPSAGILEAALAPENKRRLAERVEEAIDAGIFGAPSFVVDGELFWGNDRLDWAIAHANRKRER